MDKNWGKDVFHTIKTAFGYPPKSAWHKISYINFCKLTQITKTLIVLGQIVPPFDIKLKQHFNHSQLFAHTSQIVDFLLEER